MDIIKQRCKEANQAHIAQWLDKLDDDLNSQKELADHVAEFDLLELRAQFEKATEGQHLGISQAAQWNISPPQLVKFDQIDEVADKIAGLTVPLIQSRELSSSVREQLVLKGLESIAHGKLACVILAGGQGTRLGFDGPKGALSVGLNGRSLFQRYVERLRRLIYLAKEKFEGSTPSIPLYVMTSDVNYDATVEHFKEHNFFGADSNDVIFFKQSMIPCFTRDGKLILESKSRLATNPNGNGGVFHSLQVTGNLKDMRRRGVVGVHVIGVDNILARIGDPEFIGACQLIGFPAGNKCCTKRSADEPVGVMCMRTESDGRKIPCVVEYSEITKEQASARVDPTDPDSALMYSAGNICNHYFQLDFLESFIPKFTFHVAQKKVPYFDVSTGQVEHPKAPNAIKLEYFIFDVFEGAGRVGAFEVDREDEFAPIKNASGVDSAESAIVMMSQMCKKWCRNAKAKIENDDKLLEVSPLISYKGEGLEPLKDSILKLPLFLDKL